MNYQYRNGVKVVRGQICDGTIYHKINVKIYVENLKIVSHTYDATFVLCHSTISQK